MDCFHRILVQVQICFFFPTNDKQDGRQMAAAYQFTSIRCCGHFNCIAPDKAAYCVFTQFRGPENAIKLISVRTKTQLKSLILNSELFLSV